MLRPLLYLTALIVLAGKGHGAEQTVYGSLGVGIFSCPVYFYGLKHNYVYLNFKKGDTFAACFGGFYGSKPNMDCIIGPAPTSATATLNVKTSNASEEDFLDNLPYVKGQLVCTTELVWYDIPSTSKIHLILGNFQTLQGVSVRTTAPGTFRFNVNVNGTKVDEILLENDDTSTPVKNRSVDYVDLSGCRYSDIVYRPGDVIESYPDVCFRRTCDDYAVIRVTECGPIERCIGNHTCVLDPVCSVTGPTVIDFHGQVGSVPDRCAYTLLSNTSFQDFEILGIFGERRRKDVSLLDSVILRLPLTGVSIHLEQDGRVRLDNTNLILDNSSQLVHGVELFKNQSGITAKFNSSSDNYMSLFFDGNTAQIFLTGPIGQNLVLEGLCYNSSLLSDVKLSSYSDSGCETQYNDTADSNINCNMTTERCNLLKEAPFTDCHNHTSPEPYVTACTEMLCKYPAVDGFNCQFLEAYTRACSLQGNHTLEGWRSSVGCILPQVFCPDKDCSAHEFCGEKMSGGERGCLCRAIFASPYKSTGTYGDAKVCLQDSASFTLIGCLLEEKSIDYTVLHLNDENCTGQMDELTNMVTFSFSGTNTCGTEVVTNNSQIIYKNAIVGQNTSGIITRSSEVYIDFSCYYTQPDIKSLSFKIKDSTVIQHITSGPWNYTLTMKAYTDAGRIQAVEPSTEILLDQEIWVELETEGLQSGLVAIVTDSCWATHQESQDASLRYDLIKKGCANSADPTVKVEGNGIGTSNYFSFKMFQFSLLTGDIYLHCKLHLCVQMNQNCAPTCNNRRRRSSRSTYVEEASAFITMAWTK